MNIVIISVIDTSIFGIAFSLFVMLGSEASNSLVTDNSLKYKIVKKVFQINLPLESISWKSFCFLINLIKNK